MEWSLCSVFYITVWLFWLSGNPAYYRCQKFYLKIISVTVLIKILQDLFFYKMIRAIPKNSIMNPVRGNYNSFFLAGRSSVNVHFFPSTLVSRKDKQTTGHSYGISQLMGFPHENNGKEIYDSVARFINWVFRSNI